MTKDPRDATQRDWLGKEGVRWWGGVGGVSAHLGQGLVKAGLQVCGALISPAVSHLGA